MESIFSECSDVNHIVPILSPEAMQIEDMQCWFSDLKSSNIEQTAQLIMESVYSFAAKHAKTLAAGLLEIIPLRIQQIDDYVKLCSLLKMGEDEYNKIGVFMQEVVDICIGARPEYDVHGTVPLLYFLRRLMITGAVSIDDIIKKISAINDDRPNFKFLVLCYFMPEIMKHDQEYYKKAQEELENLEVSEQMLKPYYLRWEELCRDEFAKLHELIDTGAEKGTIAHALMVDDVQFLENLKESRKFNFSGHLPENPFNPSMFIQLSPTYLEYTMFYGSMKCLDFLLSMKAFTTYLNSYAVAGGNIRAIDFVHKWKIPFDSCLRIAAYFRRYELFHWILKGISDQNRQVEINYAMCRAAESNDIRLFRTCLEDGGDINFFDENHETPLFIAAKTGNACLLKYILTFKNLNTNTANFLDLMPMDIASEDLKHLFD